MPKLVKEGMLNYKVINKVAITIPQQQLENWIIDEEDILNSRTRYGNQYPEKFSYNCKTGEFLLSSPSQMHADTIRNSGSGEFDDYVRGIVLRPQKQVAFRAVFPKAVQEAYNRGKLTAEEVGVKSFEAQYAAMEALKAAGATGWEYQFNVTNDMLAQQTGDYLKWSRA